MTLLAAVYSVVHSIVGLLVVLVGVVVVVQFILRVNNDSSSRGGQLETHILKPAHKNTCLVLTLSPAQRLPSFFVEGRRDGLAMRSSPVS